MASTMLEAFSGQFFQHEGVTITKMLSSPERVRSVKEFSDIREDDVLVWGYPKSGNHFVHDIVRKLQNDGDIELSIKTSVDAFLECDLPDFLIYNHAMKTPRTLEDISKMPSPRVLATHLQRRHQPAPVQEGKCKVIYLLRNPKDVALSYFAMSSQFAKEFGRQMISWEDFFEVFLSREMGFGPWFDHVKDWYAVKDMPHILLVRYEDLIKDLRSETRRIAAFVGKNLTEEVLDRVADSCTLKAAKGHHPASPFLRLGTFGNWKSGFTVAQSEKFDTRLQQELEGTGLTFTD